MGVVQLPLRTWEDKMHRTISLEEVKRKLTTLCFATKNLKLLQLWE